VCACTGDSRYADVCGRILTHADVLNNIKYVKMLRASVLTKK